MSHIKWKFFEDSWNEHDGTPYVPIRKEKRMKDEFKRNQIKNNGLTGTCNQGIDKCIENKCDVITILGHDTYVNEKDRKSTRLNSSHSQQSRMPSSA